MRSGWEFHRVEEEFSFCDPSFREENSSFFFFFFFWGKKKGTRVWQSLSHAPWYSWVSPWVPPARTGAWKLRTHTHPSIGFWDFQKLQLQSSWELESGIWWNLSSHLPVVPPLLVVERERVFRRRNVLKSWKLFHYSTYFCYYSWALLHFLALFIGLTVISINFYLYLQYFQQ